MHVKVAWIWHPLPRPSPGLRWLLLVVCTHVSLLYHLVVSFPEFTPSAKKTKGSWEIRSIFHSRVWEGAQIYGPWPQVGKSPGIFLGGCLSFQPHCKSCPWHIIGSVSPDKCRISAPIPWEPTILTACRIYITTCHASPTRFLLLLLFIWIFSFALL